MKNILSIIGLISLVGCVSVPPKSGTVVKINSSKIPPLPMPKGETFRMSPRPEYVIIPSLKKTNPDLRKPVAKAGFISQAIGGPNHFAAQWVDGPVSAFSGDQITVSGHMKNLCDFGDTMELRWVSISIQHYPSGIVDEVPNLVGSPITILTQQTASVNYTVPTRQGDTFLLIYMDIRGVDLVNGAIESVQGHQIRIDAPLAIRLDGPNVVVRFRTFPSKSVTLETSTSVKGGEWQVAETIPPMPPGTFVERTYPVSGLQRYFRYVVGP